ncbi:MAG: TonB C-terminal domain-containing protein [Verrucomicrobiota bacterium]|nr:TonB C-terminal domain-containing protein [Verrucomicrobiota bacterium]
MSRDAKFWRNAAIVGLIHLIVLAGLARWSGSAGPPTIANVVWMDPSSVSASATGAPELAVIAQNELAADPTPAAEPAVTPMEDPLTMRTPPPAEEETPTPTPKPRPTATATPNKKPSPKPSAAMAKPKVQKPAKAVVAKAKPSNIAKAPNGTPARGEPSGGTQTGTAANGIDAGWYADMLHDRFHRAWEQPTTVVANGARLSAQVHLRIEQDGRVSAFKVVRSSGNVVVDESIAAIANRVTRVDPPPAGLLNGGGYEPNITFDWNAKQ